MTTILFACAVLAATLLVAAVFLLGRRSGSSAEAKLDAVAAQIDERMQAMVLDLSQALERAQEETRRSRALGDLAGTIDLDEVVARTLDAVSTIGGVDAAVVAVGTGRGSLTAAAGLESEPTGAIVGPPDGSQPRSISVEYDVRPRRGRRARRRSAPASGFRSPTRASSSATSRRTPAPAVTRSGRRAPPSSRSSRSAPGRRSTTPSAIARPAGSPTSTRSPASTTAATSTRRSPARSPAPSATTAAWRSSSSTWTTSRRSTTASATSPGTASWLRRPNASATSSARPMSRAASAATSSR